MPLPFNHRPLSPAEVHDVQERMRWLNQPPPKNAAQVLSLKIAAFLCLVAAAVALADFGALTAVACLVLALACWIGAKIHAWEPVRESSELNGLNNHELIELAELGQAYPAIGARLKEWLDAGDVIRQRDLCACRVYMHKEGPRRDRETAVARLEALAE